MSMGRGEKRRGKKGTPPNNMELAYITSMEHVWLGEDYGFMRTICFKEK
jgi:hypothetical protein